MLEFQKQILTEVVTEDGLLIISPGLGLFQILCSLVQIYTGGNHLVLLVNSTKEQDELIQEQLIAQGVPYEHTLRRIEYNTPAEKRSSMYRESGVFSITSRILAVDMLLNRIPVTLINGIIVHNAHRVKPNSMEELILRIYREHNKEGFLKALTDKPDAFSSGFAPLQSMMKSLFLRKTHLWPRFQVVVTENLSESDGHVVELRQPMTEAMETIQQNLVQCMEETLQELRRANPTLDLEDFTIENSFFKSFDAVVRRQLDPIWHRVSAASKQMVGDLKVLRQLLGYLTTYDCVSFYSFIETIIAANTSYENRQVKQSQWLLLEAGSRAISTARKRVYVKYGDPEYELITDYDASKHPDIPQHIKLVLEEQPKWSLLKSILEEIEHESMDLDKGEGASVLIMVSERRTCSQLKDYMARFQQESPFLDKIAHNFFRWRTLMHRMQNNQIEQAKTTQHQQQTAKNIHRGRPPPNKRRRVRGGSVVASGPDRSQTLAETFKDDVIDNLSMLDADDQGDEQDEDQEATFQGVGPLTDAFEIRASDDDILPTFEEIPNTSLITVQCYEDDISHQILEDTQPRFIVMFDPNPAFVRQVEVYRALHPLIDIKVYFMLYENSVEEQNYLSLIKKEKESFERLIHEKSVMTIPLPEQRKVQEELVVRSNTRIAGGQEIKVSEGPATVIVDLREFRSSLPPILYAEGIQIAPCTLQIGDYILSPDMCVERKSIADLIQSFSSGRLYTQCESMSLYYTMPILLIEFDQNKSFSLQAVSEMKENIRMTDLSSKLVMLALAFPKLRIIWSSSPHETAKIFSELKKTEKEPDAKVATAIGAEGTENGETVYNMTPQEILRSMPGVTSSNYKLIMNQVQDLEELMHLSKRKIQGMIGEELGNKLYNFIHKK